MTKNKIIYHTSDPLKVHRLLSFKVSMLVGLLLIIFISGILTYPEKFHFREDALSYLGEIYLKNGKPNIYSFIIFAAGMIGCSLLSFSISHDTAGYKPHIFFKIAGVGFALLAVPGDISNLVHSLGGAISVGSLWFFSALSLNDLYKKSKSLRILLYQLILQGSVLPYAFLYFAISPYRQYAQKFAVIGLMIILTVTIREYLPILKRS